MGEHDHWSGEKSRMRRESPVRFREGLGVKFPRATRRQARVVDRLEDYEKVAVPLVWVINPNSRTAMVYRADGSVTRLHEDDELSGEAVIPGFRCRVRDILPTREPGTAAPSSPNGPGANG